MTAYYNEIDPYAAQWLRNLIKAGHIAPGDVDERSIVDVRADELSGYAQCHFFAGIGGWSIALRLAGWPDDRPVWTGSCPCQPFSAAGAGKAADDERHLWPAWFPLIAECKPAIVFGEQVEAAVGWGWLDAVFADLEGEGYACGQAVLPACGIGAPHIRQRCWFVANAAWGNQRRHGGEPRSATIESSREARAQDGHSAGGTSPMGGVADAGRGGNECRRRPGDAFSTPRTIEGKTQQRERGGSDLGHSCPDGDMANAESGGLREFGDASRPRRGRYDDGGSQYGLLANTERDGRRADEPQRETQGRALDGRPDPWGCDWLPCTDGKARPVRPGSFPLAHGVQQRTHKLRAYGNAIVPQVAAEFIAACDRR